MGLRVSKYLFRSSFFFCCQSLLFFNFRHFPRFNKLNRFGITNVVKSLTPFWWVNIPCTMVRVILILQFLPYLIASWPAIKLNVWQIKQVKMRSEKQDMLLNGNYFRIITNAMLFIMNISLCLYNLWEILLEIVRWLFIIASRLRMEIDECNVMLMSSSLTLKYLINVGVRLLFFCQFSSHYALISYHAFIKYGPNFHPTCLLHSRINYGYTPWILTLKWHRQNMSLEKIYFALWIRRKLEKKEFLKLYIVLLRAELNCTNDASWMGQVAGAS